MTDELFIKKHHAPTGFTQPHFLSGRSPETPLLVAFSGGADSRLLLELAVIYGRTYGAPVYAAHLHHGIRGKEADRDEAFCRDTAEALGIGLFVEYVDVPSLAKASGRSLEWEAREARYAFLFHLMNEHGIPLLLTAHHADDQLETLLLRLLRGTGTKGMGGIAPVRPLQAVTDGLLLRPLLDCTKASILDACHQMGLTYVTDSTNALDDCTRNRIRHEIIPALERLAGEGTPQNSASRLARHAREDHAYLAEEGHILYEKAKRAPTVLSADVLAKAHPAVAKRTLSEAYACLTQSPEDSLSATHLDALLALCNSPDHGASVALPRGLQGVIRDDELIFADGDTDSPLPLAPCPLYEGDTPWDNGRMVIRVEQFPSPVSPLHGENILASAVFPSDRLPLPLWARSREAGDIMRHHGVGRKLKKLLCDQDVPPSLRDRIPLICTGDMTPLWFPTAGFADGYPSPTAGAVLRITVQWLS